MKPCPNPEEHGFGNIVDKAYNGVIWIRTHPREHRPDNDNPQIEVQGIVKNNGKGVQKMTDDEHNDTLESTKMRFRPALRSLTTHLLRSARALVVLGSGFLQNLNIDDSDRKVKAFHSNSLT
jgi:hypothetical protein